jgi:hypothetical protein
MHHLVFFANYWAQFGQVAYPRLNFQEFKDGCKLIGFANQTEAELKRHFQQLMGSGDDMITFADFCTWCARRRTSIVGAEQPEREEVVKTNDWQLRSYRCRSVAAVTAGLEFDHVNPQVVHKYQPGDLVHVDTVECTSTGQERGRTPHGWVSLVSRDGCDLFLREHFGNGGAGTPPHATHTAPPHRLPVVPAPAVTKADRLCTPMGSNPAMVELLVNR